MWIETIIDYETEVVLYLGHAPWQTHTSHGPIIIMISKRTCKLSIECDAASNNKQLACSKLSVRMKCDCELKLFATTSTIVFACLLYLNLNLNLNLHASKSLDQRAIKSIIWPAYPHLTSHSIALFSNHFCDGKIVVDRRIKNNNNNNERSAICLKTIIKWNISHDTLQ